MAPNPASFLDHLESRGYHPRSNKHSDALSECIIQDLIANCPEIAARASLGRVVYDLNFKLMSGTADWNVDLVIGEPPPGVPEAPNPGEMIRATPSHIQVAMEHKSLMTEHRKAVRNRKRDFEAHHDHVYRYDGRTISAAVFVINGAPAFKSPLRPEITSHRQPMELVRQAVDQLRSVPVRQDITHPGLDASTAIVIEFANTPGAAAHYITAPPAPQVGDPLHYDAFIQKICATYRTRFTP